MTRVASGGARWASGAIRLVLGVLLGCTGQAPSGAERLRTATAADEASAACDAVQVLRPFEFVRNPALTPTGPHYLGPLCSDGARYLLVRDRTRVIRLRPDGFPVDSLGIIAGGGPSRGSLCASDGTHFVLAWTDTGSSTNAVWAARLPMTGPLLDDGGVQISAGPNPQLLLAEASGAGEVYLAWADQSSVFWSLLGTPLRDDGTVVVPGGLTVPTPQSNQVVIGGALVGSGSGEFLVAWPQDHSFVGRRVGPDGQLRDAGLLQLSSSPAGAVDFNGHLSFDGTNHLFTWIRLDQRTLRTELLAGRVSPTSGLLDPQPLLVQHLDTGFGTLDTTFDGQRHVLAYESDYASGFYAQVDPDGQLVTGPTLLTVPQGPYAFTPVVASTGHGALAAWNLSDLALQSFIPDDGGAAWPAIPVAGVEASETEPALAWGEPPIAVWADLRNQQDYDLYSARVDPVHGSLDAWGTPIVVAPGDQTRPAIASGAGEYLVVWEDARSGAPVVYAARLGDAGMALDDGGFPVAPVAAFQTSPAVTFDGTDFVVAWEDGRNGRDLDIYAARISPAGQVLEPGGIPVATGSKDQYAPSVSWDGTSVLIAWQDYRGGGPAQLAAARLSPAGVVLDPSGLAVAPGPSDQRDPTLASAGPIVGAFWVDDRHGPGAELWASFWSGPDGGFAPAFPVARSQAAAARPRVVFEGNEFLVTWFEVRGPLLPFKVMGARVRLDGGLPDDAGVELVTFAQDARLRNGLASSGQGVSMLLWTVPSFTYVAGRAYATVVLTPPHSRGLPCACDASCRTGFCTDGVCCDARCLGPDGGPYRCEACSAALGAVADGTCSLQAPGTVCRAASDLCDLAGTCSGASSACPPDELRDAGSLCRPPRDDTCDQAEFCDGQSPACPEDVFADAGTPCTEPGNGCAVDGGCLLGLCVTEWRECPQSPCVPFSYCDVPSGQCVRFEVPDGGLCVVPDTCVRGTCEQDLCVPSGPVACAAAPECRAQACDGQGGCLYPMLADGSSCDGGQCWQGRCLTADAGPGDAEPDAGVPAVDGGALDGGQGNASPDGGTAPGGSVGCGCGSAGGGTSGWVLLASGLLISRGWRRRVGPMEEAIHHQAGRQRGRRKLKAKT